jgi:hypothetical protein
MEIGECCVKKCDLDISKLPTSKNTFLGRLNWMREEVAATASWRHNKQFLLSIFSSFLLARSSAGEFPKCTSLSIAALMYAHTPLDGHIKPVLSLFSMFARLDSVP